MRLDQFVKLKEVPNSEQDGPIQYALVDNVRGEEEERFRGTKIECLSLFVAAMNPYVKHMYN